MIDIAALVALCQAALTSGNKAREIYNKRKLSAEERELLIAAAPQGTFCFIQLNEGSFIRVENQDFPTNEEADPAITAAYIEAFKHLCERGYIEHDSGMLFKLTVAGFKEARRLAHL
ncbi:MAG: hypothetical protein U9N44_08010 [Chloroflexota bacterium]|nr:hypothetical protein [Chloroflexota bacterium]